MDGARRATYPGQLSTCTVGGVKSTAEFTFFNTHLHHSGLIQGQNSGPQAVGLKHPQDTASHPKINGAFTAGTVFVSMHEGFAHPEQLLDDLCHSVFLPVSKELTTLSRTTPRAWFEMSALGGGHKNASSNCRTKAQARKSAAKLPFPRLGQQHESAPDPPASEWVLRKGSSLLCLTHVMSCNYHKAELLGCCSIGCDFATDFVSTCMHQRFSPPVLLHQGLQGDVV